MQNSRTMTNIVENTLQDQIRSNQCLFEPPNQNHIASVGFTSCAVNDILCPKTLRITSSDTACSGNMVKAKHSKLKASKQQQMGMLTWM